MDKLCILKPDAVKRKLIGSILSSIEVIFEIKAMEMKTLSKYEVQQLYKHHTHAPYWQRIENFMVRGPSVVLIVGDPNDSFRDYALNIRKRHQTDTNVIHASENGSEVFELGLFFPEYTCTSPFMTNGNSNELENHTTGM